MFKFPFPFVAASVANYCSSTVNIRNASLQLCTNLFTHNVTIVHFHYHNIVSYFVRHCGLFVPLVWFHVLPFISCVFP